MDIESKEIKKTIYGDEQDIKTGLMQNINGIFIIGRALKRIKEEKKYKTELNYNTFEEYLEQRIGFSKMTGYRYIEIANKLSEKVSAMLQNFSIQKLYLIASAVENEKQAIEFIEEKHIVNNKEKTTDEMTTRELEQVIKEKKEIKRQLEEEQEYTEELQKQIQEKELQINKLKDDMENIQIPEKEIIEKEVIKEVVPESIKSQVEQLEKEKSELLQKYEEAKSTIISMNNTKNTEIGQKYYDYGFDGLATDIAGFLRNTSKYTYMEQEYSELSTSKKTLLKNAIKRMENWLLEMKKTMNESLMIGNNIYIEEENKNE